MAPVSALLVAALSITVGVAVGVLPESWRPYLWLAWPVSLALAVAYAAIEVRRTGEDNRGSTRVGSGRSHARRRLLERVERSWVAEVLDRSLYHEAYLELGLVKSAEETHPWGMVSALPRGVAELVQSGTPLTDAFAELDQAMLILGAPGGGKTTTMLELLRDLLENARADHRAPIPVFLPLASWALRREPLTEWLLREVSERYRVPPGYVRAWLDSEQLVLLLDGLDEVAARYREQCVKAINLFRRDYGTVPVAVCCRTLDYQQFETTLDIYGTLTIQPLSRQQVEQFLNRPDGLFAGLQAALAREPGLWELADNPLILSIMILAFREPRTSESLGGSTSKELLSWLFMAYSRTMFIHHPAAPGQPPSSTVRKLAFLARQLERDEQTAFSSDMLGVFSLPEPWWCTALEMANGLLWTAINVLGMGALAMVPYGWRGAVAGGLAGLLSRRDSTMRIDSFSLAAKVKYANRRGQDDSEELPDDELSQLSQVLDLPEQEISEFVDLPDKEALKILKQKGKDAEFLEYMLSGEGLRKLEEDEIYLPIGLFSIFLEGILTPEDLPEHDPGEFYIKTDSSDRRISLLRWWGRLVWRCERFRRRLQLESNPLGSISTGGIVIVLLVGAAAGALLGWAYAAAAALGGITAVVAMSLTSDMVDNAPRRNLAWNFPSPGLRAAIRVGVPVALATGLLSGTLSGLLLAWTATSREGAQFGTVVAACVTLSALGCFGGFGLLEQMRIRLILDRSNLLPIRSRPFLERATQCLFLQRSGEAYLFRHRSMQQFFAAFCPAYESRGCNDPDPRLIQLLVPAEPLVETIDTDAQYELGMLFENVLDPPDLEGARTWYTRAAEAGHVEARFSLALLLADRLEPPDLEGARTWWTRAAEAGHTEAQNNLGILLADKLEPPDLEGARTWWTRAAEAGHTGAQLNLGQLLTEEPDSLDATEGRTWLIRAAEAGDADAQFSLGLLLEDRLDPPDLAGARTYYTRAAEAGHTTAAFNLGLLLEDRPDPPDLAGARTWYTRAAEAGHTKAAVNLGLLLEDRLDPPHLKEARRWYARAAKAGDLNAQYCLGVLLLDPKWRDIAGARTWLTRAAEAGDTDAQYALGMLLLDLDPPDLAGARAWLTRAASAGHTEARDTLEHVGEA